MALDDIFGLAGRTAVITGGANGLGKGMAAALCGAGANLLLVDIDAAALEVTGSEFSRQGARVLVRCGNVTDRDFLSDTVAAAVDAFGHIDVLICAAGRPLRKDALLSTDADFDALMSVNLKAVFQWNQAVGQRMIEQRRGAIVNIASQGAFSALEGRPLYGASKAAVVQLTKTLALDWIRFGVRVNAIAPGLMDTSFITELKEDENRLGRYIARIPAGRLGRPDDLAGAVLLLASDAGKYIVGQTLLIDGGWTIY